MSSSTPTKNDKTGEKQESVLTTEKNDLKKLKFYHGVQTKEDALRLMKDAPVGDFLLRSSFLKNEVVLVLFFSVKVGDKEQDVHHYLLEVNKGGETFTVKQDVVDKDGAKKCVDSPPFKDYDEMIQYYRFHRMASGIRLNRAVTRPKWQLRHSEVQYDDAGKLGSGNFCHVYRGKLKRGVGGGQQKEEDVAIKVSKAAEKDSAVLMETRNALFAEAKIMIAYNHANVIRLFGIACDAPPFMVCMEFCSGGSLEGHLMKRGAEMDEFERQCVLLDAARGMRYLHTQKCVHRDLASRNCLISSDGMIKIADFGLSKTLGANETAFKEALKEAPLVWMAPECVQKESEFSTKSDVWAFGVLIYEVYFNGAKPFADEKDTGVIVKAIRRAKMPLIDERTKVAKMNDLLAAIWTRKPEDRADFQRILEMLVDALVPSTPNDLKKMQLNKLDGVLRDKMPNFDTTPEKVLSSGAANDATESVRESKKRDRTNRRKPRTKKANSKTRSEVFDDKLAQSSKGTIRTPVKGSSKGSTPRVSKKKEEKN